MAKKKNKGRYNFLIDSDVYDDFSTLCEEIGFVRSKIVERLMKEFIERHKEELKEIRDEKDDE